MNYLRMSALVVLSFGLVAGPVSAQKEKRPDVSGFRFIAGPKGDRPHVPGLNAVLQLSDEQKEKLVRVRQETLGSEAVVAAGRKVKGDLNATETDRQAARKLSEEARASYDRRVAEILTTKQMELVQSLQVIYGQAREAVATEYGPRLVGAKGNEAETAKLRQEARDALHTDFIRRVNEILTTEQRAAFERSAAEEKQAAGAKSKAKN